MKLVICEKPNAAEKVAAALGGGRAVKKTLGKAAYWEVERGSEKIIVVSAVGHLYTLRQAAGKGWSYPVFDVEWAPTYEVEDDAAYQKPYVDAIRKLSAGAGEFVSACDFDTEGSLIGYNVLRFACRGAPGAPLQAPAGEKSPPVPENWSRMKFSTLTMEELEQAWIERGRLDIENALAGEARHILDWYYGINLSRALMNSLRSAGNRQVMSIGRVQGPALAILAKKEREIASFVPQPYWEVWCEGKGVKFEHVRGRFMKKEEAQAALRESGTPGVVQKVERKDYQQPPPPPFDLTSLQVEAHRVLGFDPKATLEYAQALYEAALISYPRTSSQKLPAKINLKRIIESLSKQPPYEKHAKRLLGENRLVPLEGKKEDPAHPAIHPTGQAGRLGEREMRLYDLITRRFLACFSEPAERESQRVELLSGKEAYVASGNRTVKQGWLEAYAPYAKLEEAPLPEFSEGEHVPLSGFRIEEKKTQPPKRYTAASIISELERRGLGTKATRAAIVDTLFKRGYVEGKSIAVTPFGLAVYGLLSKAAPEILDEELTHKIEDEMERIMDGENERKAIEDGKALLQKILSKFEGREREIGLELLAGLRKKDAAASSVGACPSCGGQMRLIRMKTGRQFIGCSNYPQCKNAYSLPQGVKIAGANGACPLCKAPMVAGFAKGRKVFEICPNPSCKHEGQPKEVKPPSRLQDAAQPGQKTPGAIGGPAAPLKPMPAIKEAGAAAFAKKQPARAKPSQKKGKKQKAK